MAAALLCWYGDLSDGCLPVQGGERSAREEEEQQQQQQEEEEEEEEEEGTVQQGQGLRGRQPEKPLGRDLVAPLARWVGGALLDLDWHGHRHRHAPPLPPSTHPTHTPTRTHTALAL